MVYKKTTIFWSATYQYLHFLHQYGIVLPFPFFSICIYTAVVICLLRSFYRHENFGDAVAGHSTHVGQRFAPVFLCLLHIWHRRRSAVGRIATPEVLHTPRDSQQNRQKPILQVGKKPFILAPFGYKTITLIIFFIKCKIGSSSRLLPFCCD